MKGVQKYYMTNTIKTNNELDNYGKLTESMPDDAPKYNFRAIRDYCREKHKALDELTEKEIEQFRV